MKNSREYNKEIIGFYVRTLTIKPKTDGDSEAAL